MSAKGVRRDKAALSSGCKPHPAIRSSRKQPEQAWRRAGIMPLSTIADTDDATFERLINVNLKGTFNTL